MVLNELVSQLEISPWILGVIIIWSVVWKLLALWKSARNNHLTWFIVLGIFNTVGILEILYFYIFSEMKNKPKQKTPLEKQKTKPRKKKK